MKEPLRAIEHAGLRCLVIRGPVGALCAYVGVPLDHPWAGKDYGDDALGGIDVHGGLTFSEEGDGAYRPTGWYWYGWDYGHAGDVVPGLMGHPGDREWSVEAVEADARRAAEQFAALFAAAPTGLTALRAAEAARVLGERGEVT